jgi:hypothetical protein
LPEGGLTVTYEIGYRKPPKATRFAKGKSGNPKGRPKGSHKLETQLRAELQRKITVTEGGRRRTMTRQQALIARTLSAALQGDQKAAALMLRLMLDVERHAPPEPVELPIRESDRQILARFVARTTSTEEDV